MVKLVDTYDSGSYASQRKGSSPFLSTKFNPARIAPDFFVFRRAVARGSALPARVGVGPI